MAFAVTLFYGYFTIFFFFSFSLNSVRLCVRAFDRRRRCRRIALLRKKKSLSMRLKALDHMKPETVVFYKLTSEIDSIPYWYLYTDTQYSTVQFTYIHCTCMNLVRMYPWTLPFFSLAMSIHSSCLFETIRYFCLLSRSFLLLLLEFLVAWKLVFYWDIQQCASSTIYFDFYMAILMALNKNKSIQNAVWIWIFFYSRNSHSIPIP